MRLYTTRSLCPEPTVLSLQEKRQARAFRTIIEVLTSLLVGPMAARPEPVLSHVRGPTAWTGGGEPLVLALVETVI